MNKNRHLSLTEYSYIGIAENFCKENGNIFVPKSTFEQLERFVLNFNNGQTGNFLKLATRGGRKVIVAQNYVGVIETKDGRTIEILPKIHKANTDDSRRIFLGMLKYLKDTPFKETDFANLKTDKFPLLEIFISMFLSEISKLVRKGVKADYVTISENVTYLKGSINWSQQIKQNLVHKERFFVHYDSYLRDRPENRLIKSALKFLKGKAKLLNNQRLINELLFVFDDVSESPDIKLDLLKIKTDRTMADYARVLKWVKIFFLNESFTPFKGNDIGLALLFPMERVFEDYVVAYLKKNFPNLQFQSQKSDHWLVDNHNNSGKFRLRPDIVVKIDDERTVIIDTKWKILDQNAPSKNYLISQVDMYQMYAYGKKYNQNNRRLISLIMVYPFTESLTDSLQPFHYCCSLSSAEDLCLHVIPFDIKQSFCNNGNELKVINWVGL